MLSLAGYPSSMALGRNLFIFSNHALFVVARTLFNVEPENAYLIFKYAVVAQAPLAVIACWMLARDISGSLYTATTAALLIVFSPVFVLYGGQVMTDVPSVLVLATALIIHLRGIQQRKFWLMLVGAGLMGLGVNLRETIGFYAPWLVLAPFVLGWKFQRREVLYVVAFMRCFCVACVWMVRLLVHHRSTLPLGLAWLARIDARRVGATSGRARQSSSILFVLFHQRSARVFDSSVCSGARVAQAQDVADAAACGWWPSAPICFCFSTTAHGQLALFPDRPAGTRAAGCFLVASHR